MASGQRFAVAIVAAALAAGAACARDDASPACNDREASTEIALFQALPRGLRFDAAGGAVEIDAFHDGCAARPKLLVVRTSGAWCGTCLWHAAHTKRLVDGFGDRIDIVDLLVSDEDNAPATVDAASRYAAKLDTPVRVAVDPAYTFAPAQLAVAPLPAYVFVDTRTMKVVGTMSNPDPASLAGRVAIALAVIDGRPPPEMPSPPRTDDRFTEDQMDLIRGMRLVAAPPPDPTNAVADRPDAIALGKALFADVDLSPAKVSCATCHDPAKDFTDQKPRSTGTETVDRNAPGLGLAAHARWQFWDGRADTLWSQALGPIEDGKEMASSRLAVAQRLAIAHRAAYERVFGPMPDLSQWPPAGKPGDGAYDALPAEAKDAVTRVFVGAGKAIAAFERALRVEPTALDRYADGEVSALSDAEKQGLLSFFRQGCAQCHFGPRLTNDAFHVLRFETGRPDGAPDPGREVGLARLRDAEFGASTRWSDAPRPLALPPSSESMRGAFKTPSLRGLPTSAPYGHGGTLPRLENVTGHYARRGLGPEDPRATGVTERWVPRFDGDAANALLPFLGGLTARVISP